MLKQNKASTIKKMLQHIGRYKFLLIISLILAAITVAGSLYIPILVGKAIDFIIADGKVNFSRIKDISLIIIAVTVITAVLQWIMNIINNRITYNVVRDIRNEAFKKLQSLPLSFLDSHRSGDILNRITSDADQFSDGLLMGFTKLFTSVITVIGTLLFMLSIKPVIALAVVILTPLSLFVARFIAKRTFKLFRNQSEARAAQTSFIDETVENLNIVKSFCCEEKELKSFKDINENLRKCSLKATFYSSLTNPCTRFVNSTVYAAVALFGAVTAINGSITVGALTCFLSYANQYTKPFNEISGVVTELQNSLACAERLFDLINENSEIPDSADAKKTENTQGNIQLENVSFSYCKDKPLIENFNLNVKKGEKIAIVGPTGCGKTTLINLLMRFYDVDSGKILLDGTDIRNITRKTLRESFGMVLQDTWIKSGTVSENISMGKPDATKEEIENAAKSAHAHSFIMRLPQGYDTVLHENGENLSAGQRQLLTIARIMLCVPPVLILDEATSSIDTRTEVKIQAAFDTLTKGRTSFIVAHRLSTVREADKILVMKNGNITEQGKHLELLEKNGFYAELYNSQFAK